MMARPKYGRVLTIAVTNLDDRKIARTSSLAVLDRKRAHKGSNEDWVNPHDPEAGITKLKDGRPHLAYKVEHAVDLETGAVVAGTGVSRGEGEHGAIVDTLPEKAVRHAAAAYSTRHQTA